MSEFELNKQHLREVLIFCFNWIKSATDAQRLLQEFYGDNAPTKKSNGTDASKVVILVFKTNLVRVNRKSLKMKS